MDDLLEHCRNGEDDAITTLVTRYRTKALDLAGALLQDEHLAQDAVQEAFIAALARLGALRDPAAFPGWFRQIVRTQCNRIRRCRREEPTDQVDDASSGEADSPSAAAERRERHELVRRALASLPPRGRRAAEMFYLEERRCLDIGAELDIPLGTVKRRLYDARQRLRPMLLGQISDEAIDEPAERTQLPL